MSRRLLFVSGARADSGPLAPLLAAQRAGDGLEVEVFVTGIHTLSHYGYTAGEFFTKGFKGLNVFSNQYAEEGADLVLANTMVGLTRYVEDRHPDLILVHGTPPEAMAAALVGALRNIRVAHLPGSDGAALGDIHPVSKLCHAHLVPDAAMAARLVARGEHPASVFVVGSPDLDALTAPLPLAMVRAHYGIAASDYGLVLVNAERPAAAAMRRLGPVLAAGLKGGGRDLVVAHPLNAPGAAALIAAYDAGLAGWPRARVLPSLRWEYLMTLLRHASFVLGNDAATLALAARIGVPALWLTREAEAAGPIPPGGQLVPWEAAAIAAAISAVPPAATRQGSAPPPAVEATGFAERFLAVLRGPALWAIPTQKVFFDPSGQGGEAEEPPYQV